MNPIVKHIREIVGVTPDALFLAEITEVKETTCTVKTLLGGSELPNVRLIAAETNGMVLNPKIGSIVLVGAITNVDAAVLMYSEIDSFKLIIGDSSVAVSTDGIVFNSGDKGGLINVTDLVSKLNNIISIIEKLQYFTPAGSPAPLMLSGIPIVPDVTLQPYYIQVSQIENTKIKHG